MFTHAMLGTNDVERSRRFYDAVLPPLGLNALPHPKSVLYASPDGGMLIVGSPRNGEAATSSNGHTLGFKAPSRAAVDAFHAGGLANGGVCEGPPGVREQAPGQPYGAYLRDPDGNKICAFVMGGDK